MHAKDCKQVQFLKRTYVWEVLLCLVCVFFAGNACSGGVKALTARDKALLAAAKGGDVRQLGRLLSSGANINAKNEYGYTPLLIAVLDNHYPCADELIRRGAKINILDHFGNTALMEVTEFGDQRAVSYLLEHGANPNLSGKHSFTPLMSASFFGREEIVRLLLSHGADVNKSLDGETALAAAVTHSCDGKRPQVDAALLRIFRMLLGQGAHINVCDKRGWTPLMRAASAGNTVMVIALLKYNANPNIRDKKGRNALDLALLSQREKYAAISSTLLAELRHASSLR